MTQVRDNNMSGILGSNDFKRDGHQDPDQKGRVKIHGVWFWIAGWNKEAGGRKFTSLAITECTAEQAAEIERKLAEKSASTPQQNSGFAAAQAAQSATAPAANPNAAAQNPDGTPHASAQPSMDFDDDIPF